MNPSVTLNTTAEKTGPDQAHMDLVAVMERLLTVGAFYPPGHAKCDEVVRRFFQAASPVLQGADALRLEAHGSGLRIQGRILEMDQTGPTRWSGLLQALGIARLDILATASATDLHDLINKLLAMKLEADSSLQFRQLEFDHLPASASVHVREFGRRTGTTRMGEEAAGKVNAILDQMTSGLQDKGLDETEVGALREQVEEFFVRIIERMETAGGAQSTETQRELKDVLELGTHAVQSAVEAMGQDLDDSGVSHLFRHASDALTYTRDKESMEMILSVFRQTSNDLISAQEEPDTQGPRPDPTTYDLSLADLAGCLREMSGQAVSLEGRLEDDPAEFLTIALTLLTRTGEGADLDKLLANADRLLSETPDHAAAPLLERTLTSLLGEIEIPQLDRILPMLLARQVALDAEVSLAFWERTCAADSEVLTLAWPHLVNLVLEGDTRLQGDAARRLLDICGRLPAAAARTQVRRLESLGAYRTGKISSGFYQMPLTATHVVLQHLLHSPRAAEVGRQVAKAWRSSPPDEHIRFLLPALGPWQDAHLDVYRQFLEAAALARLPEEFKDDIAQLVGQSLLGLAPDARRKPAVAESVAYLGRLGSDRARPFLRRILKERKLLFFPAWPEPVRTRAQAALGHLQQGGVS